MQGRLAPSDMSLGTHHGPRGSSIGGIRRRRLRIPPVPTSALLGLLLALTSLTCDHGASCESHEFTCDNGKSCIQKSDVCDGTYHCPDRSDEVGCVSDCFLEGFMCANGERCLDEKYVCDGKAHCLDGSDEATCCHPEFNFECSVVHQCIARYKVCNSVLDCDDFTDEKGCVSSCPSGEFLCLDGSRCVPLTARCDGIPSCVDFSDEADCYAMCPGEQFLCEDGSDCVSYAFLCDGDWDCYDGSDEKQCCHPDVHFTCDDGGCVLLSEVCDGWDQCQDGSDEGDCPCPEGMFACKDGSDCISSDWICDGHEDCQDGSDEWVEYACPPVPCEQVCGGCCQADGTCEEGTEPDACGHQGEPCKVCDDGEVCSFGSCTCFSEDHTECVGNTVYSVDSCGALEGPQETCAHGCEDGQCLPPPSCTETCAGCCTQDGVCKPGDADSLCGQAGEACDSCSSTKECIDGACACISHMHTGCAGLDGKIYYYDSCMEEEELKYDCECQCITTEINGIMTAECCDCYDYTDCYQNALHWYDSCGYYQETIEPCPYGCLGNACNPVPPWWEDDSTGLFWESPPPDEQETWVDAKEYCQSLVLAGTDDWRLPTIGELRSLVHGCPNTEAGGPCNIQEGDCLASSCYEGPCLGCSNDDGPANGCYWPFPVEGACSGSSGYGAYWSASTLTDFTDNAWTIDFRNARIMSDDKLFDKRVRCVR